MRRGLCWILCLCAVPAVAAFAAPKQLLDARYDAEARTMEGTLTTSAVPSGDTAYFLLLPNLGREKNPYLTSRALDETYPAGFEESALDVNQVSLVDGDGRHAVPFRLLSVPPGLQTYSLESTILAVDGVQTSSTIEIQFTTHAPRTSYGDEGVSDETFTWRFGWYPLVLEPSDALREEDGVLYAGPTDAFPLVFPEVEIEARLTLPTDTVLSAGADHVERVPGPDEEEGSPVSYSIWNDGPTRSLAATFGPGLERYVLEGPVPIEVTYRKGHAYTARLLATYARDIIADYASRYGSYPRARLALVENPNPEGSAFSADGIALLSTRLFTHRDVLVPGILHRLTEFVLAHEIAHQWFGMRTGIDLDRDAWLSEGLAQYASVGYFERAYGAVDPNLLFVTGYGLAEDFVTKQLGYLNLREHMIELPYLRDLWGRFDEALVKPSIDVQFGNANAVRLYDKGYMVARALAAAVGVDALDGVLSRALAESAPTRFEPATLQRLVEEETGRSFAAWFAAWVYGDVSVDYSVHILSRRVDAATYETKVRVHRDGGVPQAIEVEARLVSGATTRQTWDSEEPDGILIFRTPSPVTRVTIDPDHLLPDSDRINNNTPVRIVIAADEATMPLDAYVLAPDAGSSGISLSRLDRFRVSANQSEASLLVRTGRGEEFDAAVSFGGAELLGSFGYTLTTYGPIETGSPGETWVPETSFSATGSRLLSDGAPLYLLHLAAIRAPSVVNAVSAGAALDLTATGAARVAATASAEIGVFPRVYAQADAFIGFGLTALPSALLFPFSELHSVQLSPSDVKVSGSFAVELPSLGRLPYSLLNILMIDEVRMRLFVTGGVGWTTRDESSTTSAGAEAGIEQAFDVSTLGGLLPFTVRLGVAVPLQGELRPALYIRFSL